MPAAAGETSADGGDHDSIETLEWESIQSDAIAL
jgi:hypothetical protein